MTPTTTQSILDRIVAVHDELLAICRSAAHAGALGSDLHDARLPLFRYVDLARSSAAAEAGQ